MFDINFGLLLLTIVAFQMNATLSANLHIATRGNPAHNSTEKPIVPVVGHAQPRGMHLFGLKSQEHPNLTTNFLSLLTNYTNATEILANYSNAVTSSRSGALRAMRVKTTSTTEESKDHTFVIPNFKKNYKGNWVHHDWGVTLGNVWQDTRFQLHGAITVQRIRIDSNAVNAYYPSGTLATACLGRSTIYNFPKVKDYLKHKKRGLQKHRPIWTSLRRQIYLRGRSEECHTKEFVNWREFAECQLIRNMRMEYLIPKYPLHQM